MTLTRDSVLHYWSSRYGINPRIGGRPVFTRNSAGLFTTQEGEVDTAIVNTPRSDWATVSGERRKVLTLELGRTNLLLRSQEFDNASWVKTNATVTANDTTAPDGTTTADKVAATASAATELRQSVVTAANFGTFSVHIKKGSGPTDANRFRFHNASTVVNLLEVTINYDTLAITYAVGSSGAALKVLGNGWLRLTLTPPSGITSGNTLLLYACFGNAAETAGEYAWAWGAQFESASFASSYVATTTAAASRAADSCYWNFPPVPQAMVIYHRLFTGDTPGANPAMRWRIAGADETTPYLQTYHDSANGHVLSHHNGAGIVSSIQAGSHSVGETHELVAIVTAASVQIVKSVNGAAVAAGPASGALAFAGAWAGTRLWMNSLGSLHPAAAGHAELKIVKHADVVASTAQGIMDELRAFELGPNGDVL